MGIEVFFSTLTNKYKNVVESLDIPQKLKATYLFIDFNSIIHTISASMIHNINDYIINPTIDQPYLLRNVTNYKKYIVENFEDILLQQINIYLTDLFNNHFNGLKYIYIAIDGVPSMAKMAEQKKRRYMGSIMNNILDQGGKLDYDWSKGNITPGTSFMKKLNKYLDNFSKESNYNIEISNSQIPGEGETKIVNKYNMIKFNKTDIKYIFSPDSDVVLLCLLLHSNNLFMYRYNQQSSKQLKTHIFNIINIDKLANILEEHVKNNILNSEKKQKLTKKEIINDIVFIFSLFGDDFLPRLESINTNGDFQLLIYTYILTYLKRGTIIKETSSNYKLNHNSLLLFFYLLNKKENDMLQRNYHSKQFYNYKYANLNNFRIDIDTIKNEFTILINNFEKTNSKDRNNSTLKLFINYFKKTKQFNKLLRTIDTNKYTTYEYNNFINNFIRYIIPYDLYNQLYINESIKKIIKSYKTEMYNQILEKTNMLYFLCISDSELLTDLLIYFYLSQGKLPLEDGYRLTESRIIKKKWDKRKIFSKEKSNAKKIIWGQRTLLKNMKGGNYKQVRDKYKSSNNNPNDHYHKKMLTNKFGRSKKLYILEKKLYPLNIQFNMEDKSYIKGNIASQNKYYNIYFNIDKNNNKKTEPIVFEYLKGIIWIFNHYYKQSNDYWWHYPHNKTPLMSEIIKHYTKSSSMINKLIKWDSHIETVHKTKNYKKFFTPFEQLLYVSAFEFTNSKLTNSLSLFSHIFNSLSKNSILKLDSYKKISGSNTYSLYILTKIKEFIEKNKDIYFIDATAIKNKILSSTELKPNNIIDCTSSYFISKCHINNILINTELVHKYLKDFRKILSWDDQNIIFN